ncbi:MAG TPA: MSMEG_4193 family putative phosphomutase [Ornithinicoccus sp.]|nr:MSMEG_4193 family putative phosphomutase [Ornithinicoccus sp.]
MTTLVLVRHGRTTANSEGVLAGWTPGVRLDERGREQARTLGRRLADVPLAAVVTSPLKRCVQTAEALPGPRYLEERLGECRYGAWTGRRLEELAKDPLWSRVQEAPSTVTFPPDDVWASESLAEMQRRALAAVGDWDARVRREHGEDAVWVAVSHGDVIKAVLADALGTSLDRFQRIVVDPASVSVVQLTGRGPLVLRLNDTGTEPLTPADLRRTTAGAPGGVVGGGAGTP